MSLGTIAIIGVAILGVGYFCLRLIRKLSYEQGRLEEKTEGLKRDAETANERVEIRSQSFPGDSSVAALEQLRAKYAKRRNASLQRTASDRRTEPPEGSKG